MTSVHAPQRQAILQAIQEQGKAAASWSQEQWHAAFESLFYTDVTAHGHDDLVFLVQKPPRPNLPCKAFNVLRKVPGSKLPPQIGISGALWPGIAWQDTVLLNLVVQATYELTVTSCSQELLARVADGQDLSGEAVAVTKQVFASPSSTHVNLEAGKAETEPQPAYPDIHFSVENYDDVFEGLVLSRPDDCFCVVLRAVFPHQSSSQEAAPPSTSPVLFSGYVVLQQIHHHIGPALKSNSQLGLPGFLGKLFGGRPEQGRKQQQQRHPVYMRGPGAVGLAEVAVCNAASGLAGKASEPLRMAAEAGRGGAGVQALQCALVSLSMPVDVLSKAILSGYLS